MTVEVEEHIHIQASIIAKELILEHNAIAVMYRGSFAHGTYIPNHIDDIDLLAVCVPGVDYYLGLKTFGSRGTKEIKRNQFDVTVYEFKKMIGLLLVSNPNVLMSLWLPCALYIHTSPAWQQVINNRDLFISKKRAYRSFVGYAYGQLKRMEHYKFEGYMGQKRKALVDKFGYDCKNASHLIRLLKMGIGFLETGALNIYRAGIDADELLAIKQGEYSLAQIKQMAADLFKQMDEVFEKSRLPNQPDEEKVNRLCVNILTSLIKGNRDG